MGNKKYTLVFLTKIFWDRWIGKFLSLFVSMKFLGLLGTMTVSSILLCKGYLSGTNWTVVNTSIFATIYGVKEIMAYKNVGGLVIDRVLKETNGNGKVLQKVEECDHELEYGGEQ